MNRTSAHEQVGHVRNAKKAWAYENNGVIKPRFAELMRAGAKLAEIDAGRVLRELAAVAFANMGDYA